MTEFIMIAYFLFISTITICEPAFFVQISCYLTRAPRAVSSQVIQDESRAKSGNCLAEFGCVVSSFVFNFIFLAPVRGKHFFVAQLQSFAKRGTLNVTMTN